MLINQVIKVTKHHNKFSSILNRFNKNLQLINRREYDSYAYCYNDTDDWIRCRIGNREIVGFGLNGQHEYTDRPDNPHPGIRYMKPSAEIQALREKEKGNWHLLTIDEKKLLYRSQYCLTFTEFQHPTGEWKFIIGCGFLLISFGLWIQICLKQFVYKRKALPQSFSRKARRSQLQRIINMRNGPIKGLASKWDYENKKWKQKPWYIEFEDPFAVDYDCE